MRHPDRAPFALTAMTHTVIISGTIIVEVGMRTPTDDVREDP